MAEMINQILIARAETIRIQHGFSRMSFRLRFSYASLNQSPLGGD